MAFAAGLLGGGGGNSRAGNFTADQAATPDQANTLYGDTQNGLAIQQGFINALAAQNGTGNQSDVFAQQQQLANQLQGIGNGTGPNPALAQLNQTTGNNIANQAALMAGQRGAGSNVGLLARQAAMQGGNLQQQAVGQGATLQAQQQLAALGALQQQQANMGNLAGQQVNQEGSAINGYNSAALQGQNNVYGAIANQNNVNSGIAKGNQQMQGQILGGALNGISGAAAIVPGMFSSAPASTAQASNSPTMTSGPDTNQLMNQAGMLAQGAAFVAHGGMIDGPKSFVAKHFHSMKQGGKVPGKAEVDGDSYANDKVPAVLSPGEIVVPRSITQSPDAAKKAAEFVAAVLSRKGMKK